MERIYNGGTIICRSKLNNNQKGITIISLIITIIIMLILASVTINIGAGSIENSRMIGFVSYMQAIQTKVDFIVEYDNFSNYGNELSSSQQQALLNAIQNENLLTTTESASLRVFSSNNIASQLDIDNIDDEIVVDFSTREVISLNGIEYEGKMYYTQYNLPGGQTLKQQTEAVNREVSIGEIITNIEGLNATFTIKNVSITNGTLSYGKKDDTGQIEWNVITNYTKKDTDITTANITETGTYYFRLVDNTSGEDNIGSDESYPSLEIKLTNTPKLQGVLTDLSTSYNYSNINDSTQWAYATDETDTANLKFYVWIPRFVYKLNDDDTTLDELQFLRGTSDITTEGGYIKTSEWTEPEAFTSETNKLTGVWVLVDTPNKSRHRHNRYFKNRNNIKMIRMV